MARKRRERICAYKRLKPSTADSHSQESAVTTRSNAYTELALSLTSVRASPSAYAMSDGTPCLTGPNEGSVDRGIDLNRQYAEFPCKLDFDSEGSAFKSHASEHKVDKYKGELLAGANEIDELHNLISCKKNDKVKPYGDILRLGTSWPEL